MRRSHLDELSPRCPICGGAERLELSRVLREHGEHVVEGWLSCTAKACQREFPIIDGVPQFAPDLRAHVESQTLAFLARDDLHELTESWIGDCSGPSSGFDVARQHVGNYAFDHYGDLDPQEQQAAPASIVRALDALWSSVGELPTGPVLEIGCSAGRASFELAARTKRTVLGVDLHQAKLRLAQNVLQHGRVRYPRRRVGVVYDRREFAATFEQAPRVDFWSVDAARPPFASGSFAAIFALNVIDSTHAPMELLHSCSRMLREGGALVLASPYDWSTAAAPLEHWLGGHSQRAPHGGASEQVLRSLFGAAGSELGALRVETELDDLEWTVRLHDRATMHYRLHALVLRMH